MTYTCSQEPHPGVEFYGPEGGCAECGFLPDGLKNGELMDAWNVKYGQWVKHPKYGMGRVSKRYRVMVLVLFHDGPIRKVRADELEWRHEPDGLPSPLDVMPATAPRPQPFDRVAGA